MAGRKKKVRYSEETPNNTLAGFDSAIVAMRHLLYTYKNLFGITVSNGGIIIKWMVLIHMFFQQIWGLECFKVSLRTYFTNPGIVGFVVNKYFMHPMFRWGIQFLSANFTVYTECVCMSQFNMPFNLTLYGKLFSTVFTFVV